MATHSSTLAWKIPWTVYEIEELYMTKDFTFTFFFQTFRTYIIFAPISKPISALGWIPGSES